MKQLIIVESPTKAKTISKFLGRDFIVKSSFGHVRDLPKSKLGVDVDNDFEPKYETSKDKAKVIKELKTAHEKAKEILFATDEDREGEAISWHLAYILGVKPENAKRIVFHEITKHAIEEALEHPRSLDMKLVDAQQARRILDRLVGYKLSPFLWKKVARGLSAGRVQSVAVRLVVEKEREIQDFKSQEYWTIEGNFFGSDKSVKFVASLYGEKNKKIAKFDLDSKEKVDKILEILKPAKYKVADIKEKTTKRNPLPPFTTSTLQQAANNRLGYSAKQIMRLAQQLYEGVDLGVEGSTGLITYMRTDSVNLSEKFLNDSQEVIEKEFGKKYGLAKPRFYKKQSKNAQEAHEAIRPTEAMRTPEKVKPFLDSKQLKLYELIWKRAVASQMAQAELKSSTIDIESDTDYSFRAVGKVIVFDGYLKLYPDSSKENILPVVKQSEVLFGEDIKGDQHFTVPPARYSDATLVKALEKYGIGRPSTYAPTIHTIEQRGYVEREEKRFKPTDIAFVVNDLLVEHFHHVVDYAFTAEMEDLLDKIADGEKEWQPVIKNFYEPFIKNLEKKDKELDKKKITETKTDEKCGKCGKPMIEKIGRFGKFLACTGYPECRNTINIKTENGVEVKEEPEVLDEKCEKCGKPLMKKMGRFGPFLGCSGYPDCKNIKSIEKKTGIKCPKCKDGDVIEKRTKRKKIFYGCNQYPKCDFAVWSKPTGEMCPKCKEPLVYGAKDTVKCSSKECKYKAEAPAS